MIRKSLLIAAAVLFIVAGGTMFFFLRPVILYDGEKITQLRPRVWTVGQALFAAGISIDPRDLVVPDLDQPVPLDGSIRVERAVQAYLWMDGQILSIAGMERTPAGLLDRAGIALADGDRLLWNGEIIARDTKLPANTPLVLQVERALPLTIEVNKEQRQINGYGPSAARVLWDAGIHLGPGDQLSVKPGSPIEEGMTIAYRAAVPLTIQVQGSEIRSQSAAVSVGAALAEAGAALQGLDYSQPHEDQPLPADGRIRVIRVREEILLEETQVPFDSQLDPDPNLELDLRQPSQAGQYGVQIARERVRYEDGQEISRRVDSEWAATNPVAQIIGYGTKVVTRSENTPDGAIEYWRKIRVRATSYSPCRLGTTDNRCSYTTASGMRLTKGIVAVSLQWFRMMRGQQVYIPGYGYGTIADYGGLRGMSIDLGFDEDNFEQGAIVGWVDLYFLTPIPNSIPWTLP